MRGAQFAAVVGFADDDVAGREIGQHGCARQSGVGAGGDWGPYILANLRMEPEPLHICRIKHQVVAQRRGPAQKRHLAAERIAGGGKLPFLIELPIVGQVSFRRQAQHPAAVAQSPRN